MLACALTKIAIFCKKNVGEANLKQCILETSYPVLGSRKGLSLFSKEAYKKLKNGTLGFFKRGTSSKKP